MIYEVRKNLVSCNLNIAFLKELEVYIRKQADELSYDYKQKNQQEIIHKQTQIREYEESIKRNTEKIEEDIYYKQNIESYEQMVNERLNDIQKLEKEISYRLIIKLEDKYGKEIIKSFDEISQSNFDNQIHTIQIDAGNHIYGKKFEIKVQFSEQYRDTYIAVVIDDNNAKEKAQGIIYEISRRTDNYKSYHRFFYGKINYVLYSLMMLGIFVGTIIDKKYSSLFTLLYLCFLLFLAFYAAVRFISPYSVLPTIKNENFKSLKKWLFGLIVSIIISGIGYLLKNESIIFNNNENQIKVDNNQTVKYKEK